jgi:hypothetical protein
MSARIGDITGRFGDVAGEWDRAVARFARRSFVSSQKSPLFAAGSGREGDVCATPTPAEAATKGFQRVAVKEPRALARCPTFGSGSRFRQESPLFRQAGSP